MKIIIYILVLLLSSSIAFAVEASPCGSLKNVSGDVFFHRHDENIKAHQGQWIYPHDNITTAENGSAGIILQDDTIICLGPASSMNIDEFIFNPKDEEFSLVTRMVKGTFLFLSGTIAKLSPEDVNIKTPDGTIAVRGTRFLIEVKP